MNDPTHRQIALFGGSFNPPHICHTLATLWVLQTQPIDEVWWIPTFQHAFNKELAPFEDRVAMCRRAIDDLARVRIDLIEQALGGESRTIDTVQALAERHKNTRFWLVVGADILGEVDRWKDWRGLLQKVRLIVIGRRGFERNAALGADPSALPTADSADLELPDVSSTRIRNALRDRDYDAIGAWIPRSILDYIAEHNLYCGEEG